MPIDIAINGRFLTQPITGVQRYARELLAAFDILIGQRNDIRIRLLTPRLQTAPPLKHIRHETIGRLQGHAWEQLELPRHVSNEILFCPGNTAPLSMLGRKRVVVTVHDLSYLYFPDAYSRSFRLLYNLAMPLVMRKASAVITVSESERAAILQHYPVVAPRICAIQNGGAPHHTSIIPVAQGPGPYVLYVGSLSIRKNFKGMLEVAQRLTERRQLRFVFVGSTPAGLIRDLANGIAPSVGDRVRFTGQVDDWPTLHRYYAGAACFFFPSFYEASPLPPIEAMASGCPVIAARIPSLVERCGEAALYCDPHSVEDMCEQIERLLDDPSLRESLRARGYQRAQGFTWETCASKTLETIIGNRG